MQGSSRGRKAFQGLKRQRVEACEATWCSWKQGKMKHGESSKVIDG